MKGSRPQYLMTFSKAIVGQLHLIVIAIGIFANLANASPEGGQITKPQDSLIIDLSKTYGFLQGQRLALEEISKNFPDLASKSKIASLEFAISFGKSEQAISKKMKDILGVRYEKSSSEIIHQILEDPNSRIMTRDDAIRFISEVESRARGIIPSPFLETLLTYQYIDNPRGEFSNKFIQTYTTKNHVKAGGLDMSLKKPVSWKSDEGDRPHVVQKFTSENGRGNEMLLVLVKELPIDDRQLPEQGLEELFSAEALKGMVPEGGTVISSRPTTIDNFKGGVIVFNQAMERINTKYFVRMQMYVTLIGNKMIFIQFMVTDKDPSDSGLQEKFDKFEPLFLMIANSIIIHSQYEDNNSKKPR